MNRIDVDTNMLLDWTKDLLALPSDKALAERLNIHPTYVSNIRCGRFTLSDSVLIRLLDITSLSLSDLQAPSGHQAPLVPIGEQTTFDPHHPAPQANQSMWKAIGNR